MKVTLFKFVLLSLIASPLYFITTSYADQNHKENNDQKHEITNQGVPEKGTSKHEIPKYAHVFSTESNFSDTKEDLLESIASNGLVISYTSHAKTMLDNTAAVSGVSKTVYENAEILLFCKAGLSHELVSGNPHNIVLCPYSIAIYVLTDEPERVYLSFRNVEKGDEKVNALTKPVEDLLTKIIEEVI